ncbi:MAG: IMP dehydrogenase [Bdellovibrionales bacterium]|jgi:IMP dehydrogenase|nr:IMP dehydrogenase [Bdellovibrionales bacterium]MBT3525456.1 IMP dehydrogenase [Bdellovibrionales bacterium]
MKLSETLALTYDDVLIKPGHSQIMPREVDIQGVFSRNISLNIPVVSSAMDTVTEGATAIVMAQLGGIGVIHKNCSFEQQATEVLKVKKFESGMVMDPVTVSPNDTLASVREITKKFKITGVPVVNKQRKLEGILTGRDMLFEDDPRKLVSQVMTPKDRLVVAPVGVSMEEAKGMLHQHRIEKLPVVDKDFVLQGLITIRDIKTKISSPNSNKDTLGRLRVAAAIGASEQDLERAEILIDTGLDALVVDTAHGHSQGVLDMVKLLKKRYPNVDIVAGNVATAEACLALIEMGADAIKVGIGPGSICTTRVIAGVGVPQMSAVLDCALACRKAGIPLIADGGIKYSGDAVKALAAGADSVMIGSLFAGTDEAPGETILYKGRSYKVYRGMGSLGAMSLGSKERYGQGDVQEISKLVPEGIEGQVPYRGPLSANLYQLVGGIRSGMGYVGAKDLVALRERVEFITISSASLRENHPHDIKVTKEAPNYQFT